MHTKKITIIGNNILIGQNALMKHIYKSLKWSLKIKKNVNVDFIKRYIDKKELVYHPIWLAKTLVVADRKPFSPKKTPNMIFVDAISGYRGLISTIPETIKADINIEKIVHSKITSNDVLKFIKDVQTSQINRSYILKKPKHEIVDYFLVYLPLWQGKIISHLFETDFIINANTGDSEDYMAKLWDSKETLEIKR